MSGCDGGELKSQELRVVVASKPQGLNSQFWDLNDLAQEPLVPERIMVQCVNPKDVVTPQSNRTISMDSTIAMMEG